MPYFDMYLAKLPCLSAISRIDLVTIEQVVCMSVHDREFIMLLLPLSHAAGLGPVKLYPLHGTVAQLMLRNGVFAIRYGLHTNILQITFDGSGTRSLATLIARRVVVTPTGLGYPCSCSRRRSWSCAESRPTKHSESFKLLLALASIRYISQQTQISFYFP